MISILMNYNIRFYLLFSIAGYAIIQLPDFIMAMLGNAKKGNTDDRSSTLNKRSKFDYEKSHVKSTEHSDDENIELRSLRSTRTSNTNHKEPNTASGSHNVAEASAKIRELEYNMESTRKDFEALLNNYKTDIEHLKRELNQ